MNPGYFDVNGNLALSECFSGKCSGRKTMNRFLLHELVDQLGSLFFSFLFLGFI